MAKRCRWTRRCCAAITISVIVLGCTGMIFLTGALVQFITLNQLNQVLGFKRMNHRSTGCGTMSSSAALAGSG